MKDYNVENLVVSTIRNVWGWYTASAFINGYLVSMKFDTKPTKKYAKQSLIAKYAISEKFGKAV